MTQEAQPALPPQAKQPETEAEKALRILKNLAQVLDNFQATGVRQAAAIVEMAGYLDMLISMATEAIPAKPQPEAPKATELPAPPADSGLPVPETENAPTPA